MEQREVIVLRIYLSEGKSRLTELLEFLRDEGLRGATVHRAIAGFGPSGQVHTASLADLSLDLPLTVECFDEPGKVRAVLPDLCRRFEPDHVVHWTASLPCPKEEQRP